MANNDGRVIINIDSNAQKVAKDFENLSNDTIKYERVLRNVAGTSNSTLPVYDKIRTKLKEQQQAANNAVTAYQKLANVQQSGIGFNQLNSVTGAAIERLKNLALQGRQNSAEFQKLASVVKNANKQLNSADNVVNKAIGNANGLTGAFGSLGGSLGPLSGLTAAAAAGFAAIKLKDYAQYAIQTAGAFEQLGISFRVMTGSAQIGQQLTDAIIELGAKTPMTAQQLSKTAQLLLSFGESAENIIPDLKLLGDITGGEVNRFNMLSLAFAQVGASGKLMGQDFLQMVNAGFNPLQIMSQTTGKSMGQLRKEMEEGRISFQMVRQAMADAASEGGRYFGLMEQQSNSLNGRLSTLGDTWEQVANNIGNAFLPIAKAAVNSLIKLGEAVLNLQEKMKEFTKTARMSSADSQRQFALGMGSEYYKYLNLADEYNKKGYQQYAQSYYKKAQEFLKAAREADKKARELWKDELSSMNSSLTSGNNSTGFNATVLDAGTSKKGREKRQLTISEQLQKSYNDEFRTLQDLAAQGITSGKIWDSQATKVNNLSAALERVKQATDLTVLPPFQALNSEIQKAQDKVNNLAAAKIVNLEELKKAKGELTDLQKRLQDVQDAATISPYQQKQNRLSNLQAQLRDMAASGLTGTTGFNQLKTAVREAENEIRRINADVTNAVGLSWSSVSSTISSQLSYALTTPLQEGENAFERFGNVAINVIQQIAQAWLSSKLTSLFEKSGSNKSGGLFGKLGGLIGSIWGPAGSVAGGVAGGAVDKVVASANGNVFRNGNVIPFAKGGVVSSPSMFPMAGNRTGLMGERGAEAIMPLKRAANGQLGVQAQATPANVNIYNQSDTRIETVQRPNGDTDIFIKRINNALRSERTQSGFSSALQRNQSRGVQAS